MTETETTLLYELLPELAAAFPDHIQKWENNGSGTMWAFYFRDGTKQETLGIGEWSLRRALEEAAEVREWDMALDTYFDAYCVAILDCHWIMIEKHSNHSLTHALALAMLAAAKKHEREGERVKAIASAPCE